MSDKKISQSMENLANALMRLEEALEIKEKDNSLVVDGTIQRFEFTIELFWKTMKRILDSIGIHAKSPKETLKEAFKIGWLESETAWLEMFDDRNETSHVYNEEMARIIYEHIRHNYPEMKRTFELLYSEFVTPLS